MIANPPLRRLTLALALALAVFSSVLAAALLGPSQTLAQTHKAACPAAGAHAAKAKRHAGACATHESKRHRAGEQRGKRPHAKAKAKGKPRGSHAPAPARCEDGSAPVLSGEGSFSCEDGSEPQCEDGSTPTLSSDGTSLTCPVASGGEASADEAECEGDEEERSCTPEPSVQACEASSGVCEGSG